MADGCGLAVQADVGREFCHGEHQKDCRRMVVLAYARFASLRASLRRKE